MTSSVRVAAHCASNKEVVVTVTNGDVFVEEQVLQDGESTEILIYDERAVSSRERVKDQPAPTGKYEGVEDLQDSEESVDSEAGALASLVK